MKTMQPGFQLVQACSTIGMITMLAAFTSSIPVTVSAQSPSQGTGNVSRIQWQSPVFNNPPDDGDPSGRSRGRGSRGTCIEPYLKLAALVATEQKGQKEIVRGLTTIAHPTFWFYIPTELDNQTTIEFTLQARNQDDKILYRTEFQPTRTPAGVMSVPVPDRVQGLQLDQSYQWTFTIYCTSNSSSGASQIPVSVTGLINRVALNPTLQKQLATTPDPLGRATLYAKQGIWYDALTTLGKTLQEKKVNDPTLHQAWVDLLGQVGFTEEAKAPVLP